MRSQIPILQPFPLPRSVVTLDGCMIHMCWELVDLIHATGAIIEFLEPYDPEHHPIEPAFRHMKRAMKKFARNPNMRNAPVPSLIRLAADEVTPSAARSCFYECGCFRSSLSVSVWTV